MCKGIINLAWSCMAIVGIGLLVLGLVNYNSIYKRTSCTIFNTFTECNVLTENTTTCNSYANVNYQVDGTVVNSVTVVYFDKNNIKKDILQSLVKSEYPNGSNHTCYYDKKNIMSITFSKDNKDVSYSENFNNSTLDIKYVCIYGGIILLSFLLLVNLIPICVFLYSSYFITSTFVKNTPDNTRSRNIIDPDFTPYKTHGEFIKVHDRRVDEMCKRHNLPKW